MTTEGSFITLLIIGAFGLGWLANEFFHSTEPERTCERIELEQKAFKVCLQYRPTCESVTVEKFIEYYDDKNWLAENCSANRGDAFLSQ